MTRMDKITKEHTAFATFRELLDAPGYFPSLHVSSKWRPALKALADAYDKAQARRGDARRACRY